MPGTWFARKVRDEWENKKPPDRPDIEVINEMVDKFKVAFERRDLAALQNISELQPGDETFPQDVFSQYKEFRLNISEIEYVRVEHKGIANVALVDLVKINGEPEPWPGGWSRFEIVIQKNILGQWKVFCRWSRS